jgi:hypothetical protein
MKKTVITTTAFLFLLALLASGGCEVHSHSCPRSMVETVVHDHEYGYEEYCYDSDYPYEYCCVYYDYYSNHEVCEATECIDYNTDIWYYEGEECWYD